MTSPTPEQLLTFELKHPQATGRKETAIRDELRITPARFYQLLLRAIWTEEALRFDPMLTKRLRRRAEELDADRARRLHVHR